MEGPVPAGESTEHDDAMIAGHAVCDDEPPWLDDVVPPDPEGDDRYWPGDLAGVVAESDADEAEQAEIRWRLLAAGVETGFAHSPGAPVVPGIQAGPAGGFGQGQPWDTAAPDPVLAGRADYASGQTRDFAGSPMMRCSACWVPGAGWRPIRCGSGWPRSRRSSAAVPHPAASCGVRR
ncbi:MAG TPA: hypothetical protein VF070_31450 [Streptosporangiaceae bacterium]